MGEEASGVQNETTSIVFEAATFNNVSVRRTSQKLALRSESSSRFEKGVYPEGAARAVTYALALTKQLVGGTVSEVIGDVPSKASKEKEIMVSYDHMNSIIGVTIPKTKVKQLLSAIGFTVKELPQGKVRITVPRWRLDIFAEEDIIEEVVRLYGVNNLRPATLKMDVVVPPQSIKRVVEKKVKQSLIANGFYETYLYSFYSDRDRKLDRLSMFCDGRYDHLTIQKPLNPDQKFVRKSLLPGIVRTMSKNINLFPDEEVRIFEVGNIFIPKKDALPDERVMLAGAASFLKKNTKKELLFIKGVVESVLASVGIAKKVKLSGLHERGVVFEIDGKTIATLHVLTDQELSEFKLKKSVALFEISLDSLKKYVGKPPQYKPFSAFPSITRDLAIEVAPKVLWGDIEKIACKTKHCEAVTFLSQYDLGAKKSLAFRLRFRSMERTLTAEEADAEIEKLVTLLKGRFDATLRGN